MQFLETREIARHLHVVRLRVPRLLFAPPHMSPSCRLSALLLSTPRLSGLLVSPPRMCRHVSLRLRERFRHQQGCVLCAPLAVAGHWQRPPLPRSPEARRSRNCWPLATITLMVCAWCLRVRTGQGQVELAISAHSEFLRMKARIAQARRLGKTVLGIVGRARQRATKKKRIKKVSAAQTRWYGNFAMARRCRPLAASACMSSRVLVATVTNHNGFGLCVSQQWLSCALCHSGVRKHARPGDLVFAVSSVADSARVWPHRYRDAVAKIRPKRVLVAGFQVTKCVPFATYHDAGRWRHRPDSVYRRRAATDQKPSWQDGRGTRWVLKSRIRRGTNHPFGRRDLQGQILLSSWYFRAEPDLQSAPPMPPHLASVVFGWRGRYCKIVSQKKVVSSLRKWLHKISPATGGQEAKR